MLQLIQAASGEMGLSIPTYVAGNGASDVVQLQALLNAVGSELQREYDWQQIIVEYRFNTIYSQSMGDIVNGQNIISGITDTVGLDSTYQVVGTGIPQDTYVQTVDSSSQVTITQAAQETGNYQFYFAKTKYEWPSDFDRMVDRTHWDKTKHWEMLGPETAQEWQWLKSGYIATGPRIRYRQLGGYFQTWPAITTTELLGLEYVSKNWAQDLSGQSKEQMTIDTDSCIYPDRLMIAGLKAKYFDVKGFDSTKFEKDYFAQKSIAKAADIGGRTLSFAPTVSNVLISPSNIPDSGFGGPFQ